MTAELQSYSPPALLKGSPEWVPRSDVAGRGGGDRRKSDASLDALLPVIGVLVRMIAIPAPEYAAQAQ